MKNPIIVYIAFLVLGWSIAFCQSPPDDSKLIPRHTFFQPKDKVAIRLSPDGQYVGYINPNETVLVIEKMAAGKRAKVFEIKVSRQPSFWKFKNNSEIIVGFPEENQYKLFFGDFLTEESREIMLPVAGRVSQIPHLEQLILRIDNGNPTESGFFTYAFTTEKWQRLMPLEGFYRVYFNQTLQPVFGIHYRSGDLTFFRKPDGEDWIKTDFYKWPQSFPVDVLSISADGKAAFIMDNSATDKTVLTKLSIENGQKEVLARDKNADLIIDYALTHPLTGQPEAIAGIFGNIHYHFLNKKLEKEIAFLQRQHKGDVRIRGRSEDDHTWLVSYFDGSTQPYYLYHRPIQKVQFLFKDHSGLSELKSASRHVHIIETKDGLKLPCLLFLPPDSDKNQDGFPDNPIPTIQNVHGGPWVGYYQFGWPFHRAAQLLTNRGYAVLFTEFRGATGYGKSFVDAGNLQWGEKMHQDVIDVGQWLIKNQVCPKDKLAIMGVSYGAYASYMALAKQPEMYQCAITQFGPTDLEAFLKTPVANNDIWRTRVGNDQTKAGRQLLKNHSPIHRVARINKSLLMSHGSRDRMAPQSQSDRFADTLQAHQKPFIYTVYPDEGHTYRQPESNISFMAMAERLLHESLGGAFQPFQGDLEKGNYQVVYGQEMLDSWKKIPNGQALISNRIKLLIPYLGKWKTVHQPDKAKATKIHYSYDLAWFDSQKSMINMSIFMKDSEGVPSLLWQGIKGLNGATQQLYYHGYGTMGYKCDGIIVKEKNGDLITTYECIAPDGSITKVKDVFKPIEKQTFESFTYLFNDGQWEEIQRHEWIKS